MVEKTITGAIVLCDMKLYAIRTSTFPDACYCKDAATSFPTVCSGFCRGGAGSLQRDHLAPEPKLVTLRASGPHPGSAHSASNLREGKLSQKNARMEVLGFSPGGRRPSSLTGASLCAEQGLTASGSPSTFGGTEPRPPEAWIVKLRL